MIIIRGKYLFLLRVSRTERVPVCRSLTLMIWYNKNFSVSLLKYLWLSCSLFLSPPTFVQFYNLPLVPTQVTVLRRDKFTSPPPPVTMTLLGPSLGARSVYVGRTVRLTVTVPFFPWTPNSSITRDLQQCVTPTSTPNLPVPTIQNLS